MSRFRTDFYNGSPLESDMATVDKDGLALEIRLHRGHSVVGSLFWACQAFFWHMGCRILPPRLIGGGRDKPFNLSKAFSK
jgi:hypothetical protein